MATLTRYQENVHRFPELSTDKEFWEDLLDFIEDGKVLPIVGQGIATFVNDADEDNEQLLSPWLARKLCEDLKINADELSPDFSINEVVCRFIMNRGSIDVVYKRINRILDREKLLPGRTLKQLATIDRFDFFLSTTFDSLLANAIDEVRYSGKPRTQLLEFYPNCLEVPIRRNPARDSLVCHILGRACQSNPYVVWEDDMLEFILSLYHRIEKSELPHLSRELRDPTLHYLVLGLKFSDWLVRFLLRIVRQSKLSQSVNKIEYIADDTSPSLTDGLVMFFSSVSKTHIVTCDPRFFVSELAARWRARKTSQPSISSSVNGIEGGEELAGEKTIFISYCREDEEAARRLHVALKSNGIFSWIDRDELGPAMNYDRVLEDQVRSCDMFFSIISRRTEARGESYFHQERHWAAMRATRFSEFDRGEFYVPVVVDDLETRNIRREPTIFKSAQVTKLPNGEPTMDFIQRIRQILRSGINDKC